MALPRRVPIHFVSSAAVAGVSWQRPFKPLPEISIPNLPPAPDALDGYGVSKWTAESRQTMAFRSGFTDQQPSSVTGLRR